MNAGNFGRSKRWAVGAGVGLAGALTVAFVAGTAEYARSAHLLLVAAASFGGAVLGGLLLASPRQDVRDGSLGEPRLPTRREFYDLASIGCWEWDISSDVFTWDAGMYALHGLTAGVFIPTRRAMLDYVAPQDVQNVLDTWWNDKDNPLSGTFECRIVRPDGDQRQIRYSWLTVDRNGENPKAIGIAQDVTLLRATSGTRNEDAQLRGMVECSADYIWDYKLGAGVPLTRGLHFQKVGTDVAGGSKPVVDQDADYDPAPLEQMFAEAARFRDVLMPIRDGKGGSRWVSLSGHPQFDRHGICYAYRGVAADVTESMRERDIAEGRRQAGAVGRLASGLAHEINNLLQPILIYAAFGADEAKQEEKLRLYFSRIARAAERASFIVKNVLSFARQSVPSQGNLNVVAVVRDTVDLLSGTLSGRTRIELTTDDAVVLARAERTGLAQIITNLITNAADAMADGGTIVVRVEEVGVSSEMSKAAGVPAGRYCRICVEDGGAGIAPELIGRVFDPFFTTKPQGKGTGLGLAVVSGLARDWGGAATVDSVVGSGSRFSVYLPSSEYEARAAQ